MFRTRVVEFLVFLSGSPKDIHILVNKIKMFKGDSTRNKKYINSFIVIFNKITNRKNRKTGDYVTWVMLRPELFSYAKNFIFNFVSSY